MQTRFLIFLAASIGLLRAKNYRKPLFVKLFSIIIVKLVLDILTNIYTKVLNPPEHHASDNHNPSGNSDCDEVDDIALKYILRIRRLTWHC